MLTTSERFLVVLTTCGVRGTACVGAEPGTGVEMQDIEADNAFVQALVACDPAVQEARAFNETYPSTVTNAQDVCAWPDRAEPVFTRMHNCLKALPQPNDSNLKAARADLLEAGIAYDKVIDLMRHFCSDEASPAEISGWAKKASTAFDSAMAHMAAYNLSIE